jgi:DNA-binding winged helix-turn-helix (wHTH) protein
VNVRFGPFEVDSEGRQLRRDGGDVHLTPKAFDLLALLIAEEPRVVRKDELHERLWPGTFVTDAALAALVKEVRRALVHKGAASPLIRTAHGVGYAFVRPAERALKLVPAISRWVVLNTRRIPLGEGEHLIGRDPAAAVRIDDSSVSRRHAHIVVRSDVAVIEDLDSKNGTCVNDVRITGRLKLRDGDRIQIGPAVILFRISDAGSSTDTISPETTR